MDALRIKLSILKAISLTIVLPYLSSCSRDVVSPSTHGELFESKTHHSGETDFVKLSVSMRREIRLGDPCPVDITLENDSAFTVRINRQYPPADDFRMQLHDQRNQFVPYTEFGRQNAAGDPYENTHSFSAKVVPHEVLSWRYDLKEYFQIKTPGVYSLTIQRSIDGTEMNNVDGGPMREVDVGPIRFVVVGGKTSKLR